MAFKCDTCKWFKEGVIDYCIKKKHPISGGHAKRCHGENCIDYKGEE